ncbi:hypothetical protein GCM10023215_17740 [Pseudonocardia yuanmonensis]|uniref:Uncharacterized protein n=1 Tax=Pseudonocardia yuanmonensis TaxID=1095914 RepID=A0ABP8W880_9PSEU
MLTTLITVRPGPTFPAPEHQHVWTTASHPFPDGPVGHRTCRSCGASGLFAPTASAGHPG